MINQYVLCEKQFLTFDRDIKRNEDGSPFLFTRSLRAMTARGPRVSLARSEIVEEGASIEFVLNVFKDCPIKEEHLRKLFSYGKVFGIGQWRNAKNGIFDFELKRIENDK